MAQFNGSVLTELGLALLTKAQTGATRIQFTRIGIGDGYPIEDQSELTELVHEVLSLDILELKITEDGQSQVTSTLSNKDLAAGIYVREIGLFANDPDEGEILYAVANAGALADYIPPSNGIDIVEEIFHFITVIGTAEDVTAVIDEKALVTVDTFSAHVNDASIHVTSEEMDLVNRRITRIEAYLDLDSRGVSGAQARFVDTYDGEDDPVLKLDQSKTYATAAISASETTVVVPVASTQGFAVGQEVTICDDQQFEERFIWAVGVNTLSFGIMLNSYKKGAYIARSTLERDTTAKKMRIGSWGTSTVTISEL
ncbi:phage tail protein [Brevibacillus centrosporus]|uniref:phage tail-collar fiber domain-containing protein n=2 Tax=Brevibacillus centrosporus TaxID=54910 RepID=UPI00160586DF|nr:phage tail protein [Brevibacillus centrosporus]MEC2128124.1 phage tail protein [Brevibacillus centrosporus]